VTTRLIRADEARRRVGIGRTLFEQMVARGELPQPVRVGTVRTWVESEIEDWVVNHIAAQRGATG
jgi:predicted DNA-binding transcriptional regulator AlpA